MFSFLIADGIFRRPRLRTNKILKKYAHFFSGHVINVSGSNDSDKDCSLVDFFLNDYDQGSKYASYFSLATSYTISYYPYDKTDILDTNKRYKTIPLDLEDSIPESLYHRYNVVFNHTVLEHVFDIFTAFKNLCDLSNDIVILVVPQSQKIHDFNRGYKDYWRFTPFAIDRLFKNNGFEVLFRETTVGFSESSYLFYIATKNPGHWDSHFTPISTPEKYLNSSNDGSLSTLFAFVHLKFLLIVRILLRFFRST